MELGGVRILSLVCSKLASQEKVKGPHSVDTGVLDPHIREGLSYVD